MTNNAEKNAGKVKDERVEKNNTEKVEIEDKSVDDSVAEEDVEKADKDENADGADDYTEEEDDLKAQHIRLMADFQNYKRRAEKAKRTSYSHGREDLVADLLPIIDNFERALEHEGDVDGGFKEGTEMIYKQLTDILKKAGLEEIEALGVEFDPNVHNAVMTEDTDEYESNVISEVMQKGYKLNGKVIRPSMVKVAN